MMRQAPLPASLVIPKLSQAVAIDAGLLDLGLAYQIDGTMASAPAVYRGEWLRHLRWGADTVASAARLLLLGQGVGAAALVRHGYERWTLNRATAIDLTPRPNESKSDFLARVWQRDALVRIDLQRLYDEMSELLHGRGSFLPLIHWESESLGEGNPSPEAMVAVLLHADLGSVVLQQVRGIVLDMCSRTGRHELARTITEWPWFGEPPPEMAYAPLRYAVLPLTLPVLSSGQIVELATHAEVYEHELLRLGSADRLPHSALATLSLLHRRHRAAQGAIAAFEEEQAMLGTEFRPERLAAREARYILIAELAALAGRWADGPTRDAFLAASSALRSAFLMWLEDDDRAMIPARTVLEQTARTRTWRTKPGRARRMEARGARTSPRDWLEGAGWRRFGVLNTALGELSHASLAARWDGALDALAAVQPGPVSYTGPEHTARGSALDQVAFLLAVEAIAAADRASACIANAAREALGIRDPERTIEDWQVLAWQHRAFDFGEPVFGPLTEEEIEAFGYGEPSGSTGHGFDPDRA